MRDILHTLPRPSHYAGIEEGAIIKQRDAVRLHIALAFPDLYEVGMSYLGQKILYGIVNSTPGWWAERVMEPDPDVAAILRERGRPLCTLESDTPLKELAAVGFSVTHELCYPDILNMLDLGGIPLRHADRSEDLHAGPIIMAGGGAMLGAEPLAPFIDLALLGDGEELLPEVLELLQRARTESWGRSRFLESARHIPGVYVPSFFREASNGRLEAIYAGYRPARRVIADLDTAFYPQSQVVPVGAVHNRLSLEIGRGCTRGCRFCQAGMVYRPVRERKPETVASILSGCLAQTGFDEVSFLALSAGDCTALKTIYYNAWEHCQKEQTALCLPSLRVGSVDDGIMEKMAGLRRAGATLAPEAGSQRLRAVINKGITEADLILHLQKLLEHGWRQVKLYFMIGLPTETDADLEAIADLCQKARDAGGRGSPLMQITAAISPFVPKPFTPFQWEAQISLAEIERRVSFLRERLKGKKSIRLKWHDPATSHLEGILSRGDRRLADVVERAFRKGALLSGWNEFFRIEPWLEALAECGLRPEDFTGPRKYDDALPWAHIEGGVDAAFLWREREKAYSASSTPDCRFGACSQCGACDRPSRPSLLAASSPVGHRLVYASRDQTGHSPGLDASGHLILKEQQKPDISPALRGKVSQYRLWHLKMGGQAYLSQLELQSVLHRALRRAAIPVAFSQGFHPLPLLSFGRALPVGVASEVEWFELTLHSRLAPGKLMRQLNQSLPPDLAVTSAEPVFKKAANSLSETYLLEFDNAEDLLTAARRFADFSNMESRIITRSTKKGEKDEDIRPLLLNWKITVSGDSSSLVFATDWTVGYISPFLLVKSILEPLEAPRLVKVRQVFADGREYGSDQGGVYGKRRAI